MKRGSLILFVVAGLVLLCLVTAALSLDTIGFNRINASDEVKWLANEDILEFEDYKSSKQKLNYDLLHVMYDGMARKFANTSYAGAETMKPWLTILDELPWDQEIVGADLVEVMGLVPTIGTNAEVTEIRDRIVNQKTVTVAEAAEYIYAVFTTCVINYAEIDNLDELDQYMAVILEKEYFQCSFLYKGENSTAMVLNAVRAALVNQGDHTLSYSTEETDDGVLFRVKIGY